MNTGDTSVNIEIAAAPAHVAAVMFDPQREMEWMPAVTGVELLDTGLVPGARIRRRGSYLGQERTWTSEVVAVRFPHLLTMQIADGPFTGTVHYAIGRSTSGSQVTIRNIGVAMSPDALPSQADLERLRALVEAPRRDR